MDYSFEMCDKKCFCSDCTDTSCIHCGDAGADCPRYQCLYDPLDLQFMNCENCSWLKYWKEGLHGEIGEETETDKEKD